MTSCLVKKGEAGRARTRFGREMNRHIRAEKQLQAVLKSAVVGVLLFSVLASFIVGAKEMLLLTLLVAWLLFPALVGIRDTLDAGCVFKLIALGLVMMVGLARNGPSSLVP